MAKKSFLDLTDDAHDPFIDETVDVFSSAAKNPEKAQNMIAIKKIIVSPGRRMVDADKVKDLVESINEIGLINPITLTSDNRLIAGAHRLQAYKDMGLPEIPATYLKEENELLIELAEIDENIVRSDLHFLENGQALIRRKEIYEALYPETKKGAKNQYTVNRTEGYLLSASGAFSRPSFTDDTANKTGYSERKIWEDIQLAENLTDEAKEAVLATGAKKKEALTLSRMEPEKQNEVVAKIKEAGSVARAIQAVERMYEPQLVNGEEALQSYSVDVRLSGLLPDVQAMIEKFRQDYNVVSVSAPYKNKGETILYRVYIKIVTESDR